MYRALYLFLWLWSFSHASHAQCSYSSIAEAIPDGFMKSGSLKEEDYANVGEVMALECGDSKKMPIFPLNMTCLSDGTMVVSKPLPDCMFFCNNTLVKFPVDPGTNTSLGLVMTTTRNNNILFVDEEVRFKCADSGETTKVGDTVIIKCVLKGNDVSALENSESFPRCFKRVPCTTKDVPLPHPDLHLIRRKNGDSEMGVVHYECDPFWRMDNKTFIRFRWGFNLTCDSKGKFPSQIDFPSCSRKKPLGPCKCLGEVSRSEAHKLRTTFCAVNNYNGSNPGERIHHPSRKRCGSRNLNSSDPRYRCFCEGVSEQSNSSILISVRVRSEPWEWHLDGSKGSVEESMNSLQSLLQSQLDGHFKNMTGYIQSFMVNFKKGPKAPLGYFPLEKPKWVDQNSSSSSCSLPWSFPMGNVTYTTLNNSQLLLKCNNSDHFLHANESNIIGRELFEECETLWKIEKWPFCREILVECSLPSKDDLEERGMTFSSSHKALSPGDSLTLSCLNATDIIFKTKSLEAVNSMRVNCILTDEFMIKYDQDFIDTTCITPCPTPRELQNRNMSISIGPSYDFVNVSCRNPKEILLNESSDYIGPWVRLDCNVTHIQNPVISTCSLPTKKCTLPNEDTLITLNLNSSVHGVELSANEELQISCLNDSYSGPSTNMIPLSCHFVSTNSSPFYDIVLRGLESGCTLRPSVECPVPKNEYNVQVLNSTHWKVSCDRDSEVLLINGSSVNGTNMIIPCDNNLTDNYTCIEDVPPSSCTASLFQMLRNESTIVISNSTQYVNVECKSADFALIVNGEYVGGGLNISCENQSSISSAFCVNVTLSRCDNSSLQGRNFSTENIRNMYIIGESFLISCRENYTLVFGSNGSSLNNNDNATLECALKRQGTMTTFVPYFKNLEELSCKHNASGRRFRRSTKGQKNMHYINANIEMHFLGDINWSEFNKTWDQFDNKFIDNKCESDECRILPIKKCSNERLLGFKEQGYVIKSKHGVVKEGDPELESGEFAVATCKQEIEGLTFLPVNDSTDSKPHDGILTLKCMYNDANLNEDPNFLMDALPPCVPICNQAIIHPPNYTNLSLDGVVPIRDPSTLNDISYYNGSREESFPIYSGDKLLYSCIVPDQGVNGGLDTTYDAVRCLNNNVIDAPTHAWPRCTRRTQLIVDGILLQLDLSDRKITENNRFIKYQTSDELMDVFLYQKYISQVTLPIVIVLSTIICCCFWCMKQNSPCCRICKAKTNKKATLKEL